MSERGDVIIERIEGRGECFAVGAIVAYIDRPPGHPSRPSLVEDHIGGYEGVDCKPIQLNGRASIEVHLRTR